MNQGEEVKVTVLFLRGAKVLREELRVASRGRLDDSSSERWLWSMECRLRNVMFLGGQGFRVGGAMVNCMSLWSERGNGQGSITGRLVEQTRSRMCPWSWVGKVTCWVKVKLSSRVVNLDASLQVGESM